MQFVVLIISTFFMYFLSIGFTSWRLALLQHHPGARQALIPIWNVFLLYRLDNRSMVEAATCLVALVALPLVGALLLVPVGASVTKKTGRPWILGALLTVPPVGLIGLPVIAGTAEVFDSANSSKR
jgi:hypothetical protein